MEVACDTATVRDSAYEEYTSVMAAVANAVYLADRTFAGNESVRAVNARLRFLKTEKREFSSTASRRTIALISICCSVGFIAMTIASVHFLNRVAAG